MSAKTMDEAREMLEKPFGPRELDWRLQRCGIRGDGEIWAIIVPYIDARAGQRRMDEVFGMDGWEVSYRAIDMGEKLSRSRSNPKEVTKRQVTGVIASVRIRVPGTTDWVTREDGAEPTDVEAVKGGISGAFKRALVTIGIGRYLYEVPELWAEIVERGPNRAYAQKPNTTSRQDRVPFHWKPQDADVARLTGTKGPQREQATSAERSLRDEPTPVAGGDPDCPKCKGEMVDVRQRKTKPSQPDFRCKRDDCRGAVWLTAATSKAS